MIAVEASTDAGAVWPVLSVPPPLTGLDVHVWRVALDRPSASVAALAGLLSAEEMDRAARFVFERDRRRYIVARAALRQLIARYVGRAPDSVPFRYGKFGKPRLDGRSGPAFNVSHSEECALIAVSRRGALGVDIEAIRELRDAEDIATRFFAPGEVARLMALPAAVRTGAFFTCWTRKEAYLKALGSGLAKPLDAFEVTFGAGEPPRLTVLGDREETARWTVHDLRPVDGFAAALVTRTTASVAGCWDWKELEAV